MDTDVATSEMLAYLHARRGYAEGQKLVHAGKANLASVTALHTAERMLETQSQFSLAAMRAREVQILDAILNRFK